MFSISTLLKRHTLIAGLILDSTLLSLSCYSQISFAPYVVYPTGSSTVMACIGDINNDGLNDVVVGTSINVFDPINSYKVIVLLQDNLGKLQSPQIYPYPSINLGYPLGCGITGLDIGDINNDNLSDVIMALYDSIGIYYQNNSGTLNPIKTIYGGHIDPVQGISIGDLNNDGLNDIALSHRSQFISILYQNEIGGFTNTFYDSPQGFDNQILVEDINNDYLNDVILMIGLYPGGVYLYNQNSMGTLNNFISFNNFQNQVNGVNGGIAIGDVTNDGINDLVKTIPHNSFDIIMQDPLTHEMQYSSSIPAVVSNGIRIADLNCDNRNEIIVAPAGGGMFLQVVEQDDNSIYNTSVGFNVPISSSDPQGISIGDLNNDGSNDIALATMSGLIILYNKSTRYDSCCKLPNKPMPIKGSTSVCKDNRPAIFTNNSPTNDSLIWHILPPQAGIIVSSSKDSCRIDWNNNWTGTCRIFIKTINSCASTCSDTLFVNVNRLPSLDLGKDTTLCSKNSIELIANSGFDTYTWQDSSHSPTYIVTEAGTYFVEATHICGTQYDSIVISVPTNDLSTSIVSGETIICYEHPSYIYSIKHPDVNSLLWHILPEEAGSIIKSSTDSCELSWNMNWHGTAEIFVEAIGICGITYSDTLKIIKSYLSEMYLGRDTILCDNNSLELHTPPGFDVYTWQDNSHDAAYTVTEGGTYFVEATNICGTQYDTIVIAEVTPPVINLAQDTILCTGTTMQFDVSLPGNKQYHWQDDTESPVYLVDQPGTYSIEITDEYQCFNSASITVQELQAPVLTWPSDTTICSVNTLTLHADNPASRYQWQDGSDKPYYTVISGGNYSVEVTNECGSAIASTFVTMEECPCYLDVPSAFSPNGDEVNDVLYAVGLNVDQVHFVIHNRWGQKVFESFSLSDGWDGKFLNQNMDTGVYMYSVTARSISDGHVLEKKGNITLIR